MNFPSEYPASVKDYFLKPYNRKLLSSADILSVCGSYNINLENYDIYTMGKRIGSRSPELWTKMRILGREFHQKVFKGFMKIHLISGYGYEKYIKDNNKGREEDIIVILRPSDMIPLISDDGALFKKRAIIDLGSGLNMSLEHAECFCVLPLLKSNEIQTQFGDPCRISKDRANSRKRKAYSLKKTHGSRELIRNDNYKMMYKMLLRYKKQLSNDYLKEFIYDMRINCKKLKIEFVSKIENDSIDSIGNFEIDKDEKVQEEPIQVQEEPIQIQESTEKETSSLQNEEILGNIPMRFINW